MGDLIFDISTPGSAYKFVDEEKHGDGVRAFTIGDE
jgi:hypothetical protein